MPSPVAARRTRDPDSPSAFFLPFDDTNHHPFVPTPDADHMVFGDLDLDDPASGKPFYADSSDPAGPFPPTESAHDAKPFPLSMHMPFDFPLLGQSSPTDSYCGSNGFYTPEDFHQSPSLNNVDLYNTGGWMDAPAPSSPIPIPASVDNNPSQQGFLSFADPSNAFAFDGQGSFSPSEFAALHPLPASISPSSSFDDASPFHQSMSISPQDTSSASMTPDWARTLYEGPSSQQLSHHHHHGHGHSHHHHTRSSTSPGAGARRPSPLGDPAARRRRFPSLHGSHAMPVNQIFQSASAPSLSFSPVTQMARSYSSSRAEGIDLGDVDGDATVRRKRKISAPDPDAHPELDATTGAAVDAASADNASTGAPLKPVVRPPKLAPSAWQLYFTDWIQRHQATSNRKLNVAQAAKEAGQEYANLSSEEKEPYRRKSQQMKEARERDVKAYMRTLTPDDIRRENAYRAAQRKAGKSRKSNIKDPNAPKKPLSAYFMFLQRIRSEPRLVQEVFGDETETTKQSVLAAAKWRSMTDDERKPFLAQAEQEKMEYEAARRLYEEGASGSPGYGNSINFSILPGTSSSSTTPLSASGGSPAFASMKIESESESENMAVDQAFQRYIKS